MAVDDRRRNLVEVAGLKISFENDELRDSCCLYERGEETFGPFLANIVFNMLAEAEAADNAVEWHEILVNDLLSCGADAFQIAVGPDYIANFVPVGRKYAVGEDGKTEWSSVTRLKVTAIWRR
ncbi:hypothetical protein B5K08_09560 [Rhizobium leguminosarum bv. trifolii]|uniref:Uncharacterized protein n=1 Tax=Rhizobium leguminosarum bv. trifolii TaxID=386 RepID=A0A3E1BPQ7_RHILT|nr:hypothetical protein [Rhizobium leguminosarum]RFB94429.1 hypothetical protein B5K08_09560 [Rhizobium leguminosarum bv. trifolii]RFB95800.1 hypothetical protein B5K10_09545 [Rhizobium leguminosarum bv. trifolii]